jgi:PAS domain S-box-containing protein
VTNRAAGRPSRAWRGYGWALLAVVLAIAARRFADPRLGTAQLPYGSVLVATMVVVWLAGLRPALVVVFVGGLATNFFLQAPRLSFEPGPDHQGWGLVVFFILGSVIATFGGFVHTQRARAEATAEVIRRAEAALREAHDGLELRVRERTAELARSNESLRGSEERFRLLVEAVKGYAILMLGSDGAIVAWNGGAERLFERSAEVVGGNIAQLIPGLDGPALAAAARGGSAERQAVRPGGSFSIELEITALEHQDRFVAIVHDISERKRLEEITEQKQRRADELRRKSEELEAENRRMQDAARLQSEFLANMSHELRTPLNAIIGFADLLHRGMAGPVEGQHREFLGDILISSRHLLQLINDVLDHAKVESGTLEIIPQPIELARVLSEVRDILRGVAAVRRIELQLQPAADLGSVTVDPGKLKQILYNYVSNALKFTPEGGRVSIRAALIGEAFRIEVEDTGIGIAGGDLRFLFVAFRQLDAGATKRYAGTGLGLALSKRLAEAHGGQVGVHSVPGIGSTFWVELPRLTVAATARQTAQRDDTAELRR